MDSGLVGRKITIGSRADIDVLYDECMNHESEVVRLSVVSIYDPKEFVRAGFLPDVEGSIKPRELLEVVVQYVLGMPFSVIEFLYGKDYVYVMEEFPWKRKEVNMTWYFYKISYYQKEGAHYGGSPGLILYAPNLLYKSMRPITDMSMFRGPGSRTVSKNKIVNNKLMIDGIGWNAVPVTRYAAGMSKGLYYEGGNGNKYCGTFYYNEPQSNTLLVYNTSRTFFNKTQAMFQLLPAWRREGAQFISDHPKLRDHMEGFLPPDLRMTAQDYYEEYPVDAKRRISGISSDIPLYLGKKLGLYALEDNFDQYICDAARALNVDIIILTHMVGSHQVVTEILDTRDRNDSFKSLVYITD